MTPSGLLLPAACLAAVAAWLACSRPTVAPRLTARPLPAGDDEAAVPGPSRARLRMSATLGASVAVLLVLPWPAAAPCALLAGLVVWRRSAAWEPAARRRRRERLHDDLPHVVDLLAACLAAGAAPAEALTRVVPLLEEPARSELAPCADRLRWGADAVTVWSELARHPQLGRLGAALRRAAESGAPVVEALDRLAEDLRSVQRTEVEARVRQIEVRAAVPLGVCLLPAFLLLGVVPLVAGSALRLLHG